METTFMSIHNLTPEANILFASESIVDILGFLPEEVTGRSCFDYFHPDEVPFARHIHSRGVQLDKAAVLHYARIRNRHGDWVGCECVFTIVYEVLVACTSIYKGDAKSEKRAVDAPTIRRLFASSPRDPRYHMLEHLSSKFRSPPQPSLLEPRAALILNRFTRSLTVMYATNAVSSILGISPDQFKDKSFYECMQERCLPDAIRCLESAKANDSIAYLRFWYRDPRRPEDFDQEIRDGSQSSDSEDGGVGLDVDMDHDTHVESSVTDHPSTMSDQRSRSFSGQSTDIEHDASNLISDQSQPVSSSSSLLRVTPDFPRRRRSPLPIPRPDPEPYELEAVVSCTSDGLVVIIRRAHPLNPTLQRPPPAPRAALFAAPWGVHPIYPHQHHPDPQHPFRHGLQAPQVPAGGPPMDEFMNSIREVAVFAWSLAGINGNIASYGRGTPTGEAQPPDGLPIWDPFAEPSPAYSPPENQAMERWTRMGMGMDAGSSPKMVESGNTTLYTHSNEEDKFHPQNEYTSSSSMKTDIPTARAPHIEHAAEQRFLAQFDPQYNSHSHDQWLHQRQANANSGFQDRPNSQ